VSAETLKDFSAFTTEESLFAAQCISEAQLFQAPCGALAKEGDVDREKRKLFWIPAKKSSACDAALQPQGPCGPRLKPSVSRKVRPVSEY